MKYRAGTRVKNRVSKSGEISVAGDHASFNTSWSVVSVGDGGARAGIDLTGAGQVERADPCGIWLTKPDPCVEKSRLRAIAFLSILVTEPRARAACTRRHHDLHEVARRLGRVVNGWLNHYAVPGSRAKPEGEVTCRRFLDAICSKHPLRWG